MTYLLLLSLFLSIYGFSQNDLKHLSTNYGKFIINDKYFSKSDSIYVSEVFNYLDENPDLIEEVLFINSKDLHSNKLNATVKIKYTPKTKVYKLIAKEDNSEIDFASIKCLNSMNFECYNDFQDNKFKVKKGKNTVYHFVAQFKGESFTGKLKDFHDLMIIEVKDKIIQSGYHLTKEWAELPLGSDLYKVSAKNIVLVDSLPISLLNFKQIDDNSLLIDEGLSLIHI